jgi:hypothetical protein
MMQLFNENDVEKTLLGAQHQVLISDPLTPVLAFPNIYVEFFFYRHFVLAIHNNSVLMFRNCVAVLTTRR